MVQLINGNQQTKYILFKFNKRGVLDTLIKPIRCYLYNMNKLLSFKFSYIWSLDDYASNSITFIQSIYISKKIDSLNINDLKYKFT